MYIQESATIIQAFRTVSTPPEKEKAQSFTGKQEMRVAVAPLVPEV